MFSRPILVKSMQNANPPPPSLASPIPVLDRVIAIAPAPLLPGEKETDYTSIAVRLVHASAPRDAIEEFLIRDIIDLTWEILRIRRVKAGILRASVGDGVSKVLAGVGHPYHERDTLGRGWAAGDERARTKVEAILTKAGMTIDEVTAKTLESKLDSYERLDRMLASLEARRNNALREIDRHRAALGGVVRQSIEEIEDVDFSDVETGQATTGTGP
jgi:hypothetical protein